MKRNSSLCFFVNIGRSSFLAPPRACAAIRFCTNGERTIYVPAAFRKPLCLLVERKNVLRGQSKGCGIAVEPDPGKSALLVVYARDGDAQGAKFLGFLIGVGVLEHLGPALFSVPHRGKLRAYSGAASLTFQAEKRPFLYPRLAAVGFPSRGSGCCHSLLLFYSR